MRGRTAQREQSRHEAEIGVRLARVNELVDLVETGEVVQRLTSGWAGRPAATAWQLGRPGDVADGNESVSFYAASLILSCVLDKGQRLDRDLSSSSRASTPSCCKVLPSSTARCFKRLDNAGSM